MHALITDANVPLMRVGFLPIIPTPVTDYATVPKALTNFQTCCQQLSMSIMAVVSDEGVFHLVVDIVMNEPENLRICFQCWECFIMPKCSCVVQVNILLALMWEMH